MCKIYKQCAEINFAIDSVVNALTNPNSKKKKISTGTNYNFHNWGRFHENIVYALFWNKFMTMFSSLGTQDIVFGEIDR